MKTRCENRQRPESRKTVRCKGKITISQYIDSKMHAAMDMGQVNLTDHSLLSLLEDRYRYQ